LKEKYLSCVSRIFLFPAKKNIWKTRFKNIYSRAKMEIREVKKKYESGKRKICDSQALIKIGHLL
jgi:hypothetical protein